VFKWCKECNAKRFQQDFPNWTSGNKFIDRFIQDAQLNASRESLVLEWIPYNRFENIKYFAKGGFGTVYRAIWLDGHIKEWSNDKRKWVRYDYEWSVALKSINNSSNLNEEFLNEV